MVCGHKSGNLAPQTGTLRDPRRPPAFMQIPKTSGVSLAAGLANALSEQNQATCYDHSLFGTFYGFQSVDPRLRQKLYAPGEALPSDRKFLAGHLTFSTIRSADPDAQIVSVLREPLVWLISQGLFWRQTAQDDLVLWRSWSDRVSLSNQPLADFLSEPSLAAQTDNIAVRMLVWPHPLAEQDVFIDPTHDETMLASPLALVKELSFLDDYREREPVCKHDAGCGHRHTMFDRMNPGACRRLDSHNFITN